MTFECDYSFLLTLHVINWNMSLVTQTILFSLTLNKIITFWFLNHSFPLSLFSMSTASLKCTSNVYSSHSISACTEWSVKSYEHKQKPIKIHNLHIDCWRCKTKKSLHYDGSWNPARHAAKKKERKICIQNFKNVRFNHYL